MKTMEAFRKKLNNGEICLGAYISLKDPFIVDAIGRSVDFFWLDLEHTPMSIDTMSLHLLAARGQGVPAIVRLPDNNTSTIKRVLDTGAQGIIVPQVRSADEVRKIVSDCKYPPVGKRGYGPMVPSEYGRHEDQAFIQQSNQGIFVSVMMETADALRDIDNILYVKGLDSLVIGPMDLSGELGHLGQTDHPEVQGAIDKIIMKARSQGIFVGAGSSYNTDFVYRCIKRGVQWISIGCDFEVLYRGFDDACSLVRKMLSEDFH